MDNSGNTQKRKPKRRFIPDPAETAFQRQGSLFPEAEIPAAAEPSVPAETPETPQPITPEPQPHGPELPFNESEMPLPQSGAETVVPSPAEIVPVVQPDSTPVPEPEKSAAPDAVSVPVLPAIPADDAGVSETKPKKAPRKRRTPAKTRTPKTKTGEAPVKKPRAPRKPRKTAADVPPKEKKPRVVKPKTVKKRVPRKAAAPRTARKAARKSLVYKPVFALRFFKLFKYTLLFLLVIPFLFLHLGRFKKASLTTDKDDYLRYGYVDIEAAPPDEPTAARWRKERLLAGVFHNDAQVSSIAGFKDVPLELDDKTLTWKGRFPIPWNPPRGRYSVKLLNSGLEPKDEPVREFTISKRSLPPLKKGFSVLTLEYSGRYAGLTMKSPTGEKKPAAEALSEWTVNLKADALWVLVGKTTGVNGRVWDTIDYEAIRKIGQQCHKRGIKFGVWVMCYLTFPEKEWLPYQWAYDVADGRPVRVRSVSLSDPKRPDDIADVLVRFRDMPEVDFLGLDYIRNALGGYEMCEEFYRDMWWVAKPEGWEKMNHDQRVVAFARKKIQRTDRNLIEAWEWWRAVKVAGIVHHIKSRLGDSKLLWTYTLGWDKGWQHGQDPVMIVDAGSDIDAVMLYEADDRQYGAMMRDWGGYLDKGDTRLVVGDIVDAPLHQKRGSSEFTRRLNWAGDEIYGPKGPAEGVFIHDLGRLLYGRKGGETTQNWADASRNAIIRHKRLYGGPDGAAAPAGAVRQ